MMNFIALPKFVRFSNELFEFKFFLSKFFGIFAISTVFVFFNSLCLIGNKFSVLMLSDWSLSLLSRVKI